MLYTSGKGRYQAEYEELWDRFVPVSGQANTVQGELVRVIGKLADQYYRNGRSNWDRGFRMLTNILYRHLRDPAVFSQEVLHEIQRDIAAIRAWGSGELQLPYTDEEDPFDCITDRVVEWCQHYTTPIAHIANPKLYR